MVTVKDSNGQVLRFTPGQTSFRIREKSMICIACTISFRGWCCVTAVAPIHSYCLFRLDLCVAVVSLSHAKTAELLASDRQGAIYLKFSTQTDLEHQWTRGRIDRIDRLRDRRWGMRWDVCNSGQELHEPNTSRQPVCACTWMSGSAGSAEKLKMAMGVSFHH